MRTDELRHSGGTERGGSSGGGAPFVKWNDKYAWLEGEITGTFTTKYGLAVTMKVQALHENGLATQGRDEDGNNYQSTAKVGEEVNIGMGSATLDGKITAEDMGKVFHVAFEGWEDPKGGGNRYRLFAVIELEERSASVGGPPTYEDQPDSIIEGQAAAHDSEIPF